MVDTTNTRVENHWNLAIDSSDLFCCYDEISSFSYWGLVFSSGDRTLPPLLIAIKNYRAIYMAIEELSSLWFGYVLGPQDLTDLNKNYLRAIFNHSAFRINSHPQSIAITTHLRVVIKLQFSPSGYILNISF
jgi:hypothetical protein